MILYALINSQIKNFFTYLKGVIKVGDVRVIGIIEDGFLEVNAFHFVQMLDLLFVHLFECKKAIL